MSARNGKIARLPARLRTQLNERLDQGEESPALLPWLNARPEVQAVVQEHFNGVPISKQNLSDWRQGGFQDWLLRRDLRGEAQGVAEVTGEMAGDAPEQELIDNVGVVLAARLGSLLTHWNGELNEQLEAKERWLSRICATVVRLQKSTHQSRRERLEERRQKEAEDERERTRMRQKFVLPLLGMARVNDMTKELGGSELARKYARAYWTVMTHDFDGPPDLSFLREKESPPPEEKPLAPKPMEPEPAAATGGPASSPVKVGQAIVAEEQGNPKNQSASENEPDELQQLRAAALKGDGSSAYHLGVKYRDGVGAAKDLAKARQWLVRASGLGIGNAKLALAALEDV